METYGSGINAFPYLWMSFGVGAVLIFGYSSWLCAERRKLARQLAVVKKNHKP